MKQGEEEGDMCAFNAHIISSCVVRGGDDRGNVIRRAKRSVCARNFGRRFTERLATAAHITAVRDQKVLFLRSEFDSEQTAHSIDTGTCRHVNLPK